MYIHHLQCVHHPGITSAVLTLLLSSEDVFPHMKRKILAS